jgi:hypothetical protein
MEETTTVSDAAAAAVRGTHPLVTMVLFAIVIASIVLAGTYVSMMRKGERLPESGLKQFFERFTPAAE